ncbi:hydroxyethylthiazole kinase [uncultured Stomatobaculum sp.]|nr:hydroxyethylthiazole kinase [uncultured Stomatobaculum sp.]
MNGAEALLREALPRLDALRETAPLVHCMTGAVSVNFCANTVLALGARPICAEHPAESAEIAAQAAALSLSLANITEARDCAMRLAAGAARAADIPMAFDAVGVGASMYRRELVKCYLAEKPWLIKGNASEIRALLLETGRSGAGVDVGAEDRAERGEEEKILALACDAAALARREDTVVLLSGAVDLLTDGERCFALQNGVPLLGKICGSGCALNCLAASFLALKAGRDKKREALLSALLAVTVWNVSAETAEARGPGSLAVELLDRLGRISGAELSLRFSGEEVRI